MTLAVKKPARLAPPAAATMIGRGQGALRPAQPFFTIQRSTASSRLVCPVGALSASRRTVWLSPNSA